MEQYGRFAENGEFFTGRDRASTVILPVPYDKTSTWTKGADKGPFALLEAFTSLETYDIETGLEACKKGIYVSPPEGKDLEPEEMTRHVEDKVKGFIAEGKTVVTLGGEHSVSIGAVKAYAGRYDDLSVLQLDAHSDLRDEYEGSPYNHACVMARIGEVCPFVQVGIRSVSAGESGKLIPENVFFAKDIAGGDDWMEKAAGRLSNNVYVTIDLDVFDPSIMPSTGTPQPGGLGWYTVTRFLKKIVEKKNVVGFDVVELCPIEGIKTPEATAAKLVYKMLSYIDNANLK